MFCNEELHKYERTGDSANKQDQATQLANMTAEVET
jgi:hypothetical protein